MAGYAHKIVILVRIQSTRKPLEDKIYRDIDKDAVEFILPMAHVSPSYFLKIRNPLADLRCLYIDISYVIF